jgi:hypothetical protein
MDAPIAYGFHSGLPWAASAGLLQNGDKAGPIACKSRIRGKPSCPLRAEPLSPGAKRPGLREERSVHLR